MDAVKKRAVEAGYKKFLLRRTIAQRLIKPAIFYLAQGFVQTGQIDHYLPDGSAMIVFSIQLSK